MMLNRRALKIITLLLALLIFMWKVKEPKFVPTNPDYIFVLKPGKNTYVIDMRL